VPPEPPPSAGEDVAVRAGHDYAGQVQRQLNAKLDAPKPPTSAQVQLIAPNTGGGQRVAVDAPLSATDSVAQGVTLAELGVSSWSETSVRQIGEAIYAKMGRQLGMSEELARQYAPMPIPIRMSRTRRVACDRWRRRPCGMRKC
jgi:hypothetical protein